MNRYPARLVLPILATLISLILGMTTSGIAPAANISWDDGGFLFGKDWSDIFNWAPNGSPAGDDLLIGNLAAAFGDSTTIDQDFAINSLALFNGADADTAGNFLDVAGDIVISGAGSTFIVSEYSSDSDTIAVKAEDIIINSGGALVLKGGRVKVSDPGQSAATIGQVVVETNSFLSGYGILRFQDFVVALERTQIINDGTLKTGRANGAPDTDRFTLSIQSNQNLSQSRLDLDGTSDNGVVVIEENTTLDLQFEAEVFHSTMTFEAGSVLELSDRLFTNGATINVNAGLGAPGVPATAIVRGSIGGGASHTNATQFNINSGTFISEGRFELNAFSTVDLAANTALSFKVFPGEGNTSNIDGSLNFNGPGTELIVNQSMNVNINTPSFDWDGPEDATSTINSGGTLRIYSNDISPDPTDDSFDGTININGAGRLQPYVVGGWIFSGTMNLASLTDDSAIVTSTELMTVDGGQIIATGDGLTWFNTPIAFTSDPSGGTSVASSSTIGLINDVSFLGGSIHTGDGTMLFSGAMVTVNGNQTIDMPGGMVVLDFNRASSEPWQLNADLTINANSLGNDNAFGDNFNASTDTILINNDTTQLSINLTNPNDEWTLASGGLINILGGAGLSTSIAGSDLNIEGAIIITDGTLFTARIDLESSGEITINTAGGELRLSGGNALDRNTINGGTITGAGKLSSNGAGGLVGNGTIDTDVAFNAISDLLASGGTLTVNGQIQSGDSIGTNDATGKLSLMQPLDTANLTALELNGGTVTTNNVSTINTGLIRGNGLFQTNFLRNNGLIRANGGTLVIDTAAAPNLDGNNETGDLEAVTGSLQILKKPADALDGTITIGGGQFVDFQSGWNQGAAGTLNLNGTGQTESEAAEVRGGFFRLNGNVNVDQFGRILSAVTFRNTVAVNLPDANDLLRVSNTSRVQAGAAFAGLGSLRNDSGVNMTLDNGADVGVQVENLGNLILGDSTGMATVLGFEQFVSGSLFFQIDGTDSSDYDRLIVEQLDAILAGEFDVTLINGFTPSLGDTFPILQVITGNLVGTFNTIAVDLPALPGSLDWFIDYNPATGEGVTLEVVGALFEADFDNDSDVDVADLAQWEGDFGSNGGSDADADGDSDGADFLVWQRQFGSGVAPLAASQAVPEPSTVVLLAGLATLFLSQKR